ncbi:MAG: TIGR03546 family protein [Calditrichaeota bacterium]|nr:TIGR03546 family protein [Calditrichota bacterium]
MIWLKIVSKFIKAFRSGETPGQIAAGFAVGFFIGLMPFWTLQTLILFFILILVNINLAAATVAFLIANMIAYLLDPVFHSLGYFILTQIPFLQGIWEVIYNSVFGPLTRFYNTVVMGSFVSGLILFFPIYFGMKKFVVSYREKFEEKIKKWKIVQVISGSKVFQFYEKVRDLGGN